MGFRRQKRGEDAGSFDSLLDTMTNVVGILVILLVVTQIGMRGAIRRIQYQLPDVTVPQLDAMRKAVGALRGELRDLESRATATTSESVSPLALAQARREVEALTRKLMTRKTDIKDFTAIRKAIDELRKKVSGREKAIAALQKEIARLKALLERTPLRKAPPAKVIRLPSPRPAPAGAQCVWFTCKGGRIAYADTAGFRRAAKERIVSLRQTLQYNEGRKLTGGGLGKWQGNRGKKEGLKPEQVVYDPAKVVDYFDKRDVGTRDYRFYVKIEKNLGRENLYVAPRPSGGETATQIRYRSSKFVRALRSIDPKKQYVRFLVWPDGFETYILARELVDRLGVPAGWTITTAAQWKVGWEMGLKMRGEKAPPPPKPAPEGAKPRPPPNVLD